MLDVGFIQNSKLLIQNFAGRVRLMLVVGWWIGGGAAVAGNE
jgi:hypothetical protein